MQTPKPLLSTTMPLADMDQQSRATSSASLAEYIAILRRRRPLILRTFAIILILGTALTLHAKPVYQGTAELLVDSGSNGVMDVDASNPISPLFAPRAPQPIDTQVQLVQTLPVLQRAADALHLDVDDVLASISVSEVAQTNVVEVDARSYNPKAASDIANAVVKAYVAEQQAQDLSDLRKYQSFVESKLAQAKQTLTSTSRQLESFEGRYHISALSKNRQDQTDVAAAIASQIQQTTPDLAAAQAQVARDKQLLASEPAAEMTPLSATNPEIAPLMAKITDLQVQRASLTQPGGFTSKAPQVRAIDGQIAELQSRIAHLPPLTVTQSSSPNSVRDDLRSRLAAEQSTEASLDSRLASLRNQLASAQGSIASDAALGITSDQLSLDYQAALASEKMYTDQLRNLALREQADHATAQIVDLSDVPDFPIKPNKPEAIFFSAVMGLIVGICLALLAEFLDDHLYTVEDAERILGLPALGRIPKLPAAQQHIVTGMNPLSPFAESYRLLRTNLQFASIDAPVRTLLITSATPSEGKSTVAANLAFSLALTGKRVALVDANLRRPAVHRMLNLPAVPGLTDVLLGEATLADTLLENDDHPGVMTVSCGSTPPNPGELLGSERFRSVLHDLTNLVDIVIIDSPPLLAGADAQVLAANCDGVLLVMLPGQTSKAATKMMMEQLRQARANVMGVAYNYLTMPPTLPYDQTGALASESPVAKLDPPDLTCIVRAAHVNRWRQLQSVTSVVKRGRVTGTEGEK